MRIENTVDRSVFDTAYETGTPPWVIGEPQPAIVELADLGAITGAVLDAGCGSGEHTIHLARLGYAVLGIDFSEPAIVRAKANAAEQGVPARFEVADALRLDGPARFDTVLDSALFHVFDQGDQRRYADSLAGVCRQAATVYVLALAEGGAGVGPHIHPDAIRAAFTENWLIDGIADTQYRAMVDEQAAERTGLAVGIADLPAYLAKITRR